MTPDHVTSITRIFWMMFAFVLLVLLTATMLVLTAEMVVGVFT